MQPRSLPPSHTPTTGQPPRCAPLRFRTLGCLVALALMVGCAQGAPLAFRWSAEVSRAEPFEAQAFHGETFALEATPMQYGKPLTGLTGAAAKLYWQTPGMEPTKWYTAPGAYDPATGALTATWTPAMDVGGDRVTFFLALTQGDAVAYRIHGRLRLAASPGFNPAELVPEDVRRELVEAITAEVREWADGRYLTAEADPTVSEWAKAPAKPVYGMGEIGGLADALAAKQDRGDYLTAESDPTVSAWAKAAQKPAYAWDEITGKPTAFAPAAHTHAQSDVTGLSDALAAKADAAGATLTEATLVECVVGARRVISEAARSGDAQTTGYFGTLAALGCEGETVWPRRLWLRRRSGANNSAGALFTHLRILRIVNGAWTVAWQSENAIRMNDYALADAAMGPWEMANTDGRGAIPSGETIAIVAVSDTAWPATGTMTFSAKTCALRGGMTSNMGGDTSPAVQAWAPWVGVEYISDGSPVASLADLAGVTLPDDIVRTGADNVFPLARTNRFDGELRMVNPRVSVSPTDATKDISLVPTQDGLGLEVRFPNRETMYLRPTTGVLATVAEVAKKQDKIGASASLSLMHLTASGTVAAKTLTQGGAALDDLYASKASGQAAQTLAQQAQANAAKALSDAASAKNAATSADTKAGAALTTAQAAQTTAEAAMPKSGGTFTGGLNVMGEVSAASLAEGGMNLDEKYQKKLIPSDGISISERGEISGLSMALEHNLRASIGDGPKSLGFQTLDNGEIMEMAIADGSDSPRLYRLATQSYVDDAVAAGGGSYTLPAATASALGGVKVGPGLAVAADGTLSATPAAPQVAERGGLAMLDGSEMLGTGLGLAKKPLTSGDTLSPTTVTAGVEIVGEAANHLTVTPWDNGEIHMVRFEHKASWGYDYANYFIFVGERRMQADGIYHLRCYSFGGKVYAEVIHREEE